MALSQLPAHHITSNVMAMGRSRPLADPQSPVSRISDKARDCSRGPSTIQSMLKNTTETGDVGPFSTKPTRFPQTAPKMVPLHDMTGQQDMSRKSFAQQRHGDGQSDMSASYPGNWSSNSLASMHLPQNQRSYRPLSRGPANDDERSYSIARSSYTNQSGPSPRLHSSHRFQGQGDMNGVRPRSPYAYPTRLKRPGFRPSSPAYSDVNRPFHPPLAGFYPETSFQPRSTTSTQKRVPSVFQSFLGHHDATSPYRSFSPGVESYRTGAFSPISSLVPTPGLPMGHVQSILKSREALISDSTHAGWESRRSASPLPAYYDYTEAFDEESHVNVPISPGEGQAIPQDNIKMYDELVGKVRSTSGIIEKEILTRASHEEEPNVKEGGPKLFTQYQGAALGAFQRGLKQESSLMTSSKEELKRIVSASKDQTNDNVERSSPHHVHSEESIDLLSESPGKLRYDHREAASSDVTTSSVALSPQSVSSGGSMYSVQSSARPENSILSPGSAGTVKPPAFQSKPTELERLTPEPLKTRMEKSTSLKAGLRESSSDRWSHSESSQIYAPTPERSTSSPSHRRRFTRIFSIGEDLISDSESDTAPKQTGSNQNTNSFGRETFVDTGTTAGMPASKSRQKSISLPDLITVGEEDLSGPTLRDELMKARESVGDTKIRISTNANNDQTDVSSHSSAELTSKVETPVDFSKPAAIDNSAVSIERIGRMNQTAGAGNAEPMNLSVGSLLRSGPAKLEALPGDSTFKSKSPTSEAEPSSLPYSFVPILASEEDSKLGKDVEALVPEQKGEVYPRAKPSQPILNLKRRAEKASIESLPSSRPWNLATSYPWTGEDPKLDVKMPETSKDFQTDDMKLPRFKLRIHRASSSTAGPVKLMKQVPPPLELFAARKTSLSSELFSSSTFNRRPRPSVTITQNNSSRIGPSTSRSAGNLSSPPRTSIASPCISLVPPSPGLNLEVRSFFSDDSSQVQPKGSLRKRLSQLRAMATRATSSDDVGGAERGLLSSATGKPRTGGRSMKQEGIPSEGLYNLKHIRWRLEEKVKGWLHRSKDRVRFWGGKMRLPGPTTRPGAGVYSGI